MDISVEELKRKIDEYFDNVSEEQLKEDCKKAGIEFYNKIKVVIFSDVELKDKA